MNFLKQEQLQHLQLDNQILLILILNHTDYNIIDIIDDEKFYILKFNQQKPFNFDKKVLNDYNHSIADLKFLLGQELNKRNIPNFIKLIQSKLSKKQ
jgi:hypothetical protein